MGAQSRCAVKPLAGVLTTPQHTARALGCWFSSCDRPFAVHPDVTHPACQSARISPRRVFAGGRKIEHGDVRTGARRNVATIVEAKPVGRGERRLVHRLGEA